MGDVMRRAILALSFYSLFFLIIGNRIMSANNQLKEKKNLKLTVVYDNYAYAENLQTDW